MGTDTQQTFEGIALSHNVSGKQNESHRSPPSQLVVIGNIR
jgi:hypothetical protein